MTASYCFNLAADRRELPCALSALAVWLLLTTSVLGQQQSDEPQSTEAIAQRVFALAHKQEFSEVALLLETLAEQDPRSPARVAAVLYASERSYAAGRRPQAETWLKPLASTAPQPFQAAIEDALAWCRVNPCDLKVPTARLLELAEQHAASSFAPAALQVRAEKLTAAGRADEAIFVYHALLAQFPKSRHVPTNLLSVARLHHELDQQREAWDYLQRLVAGHPEAGRVDEALYLGVQVAQRLGHQEAAAEWLQKLTAEHEQSPYWPDAALRSAEQHAASAEAEEARTLAKRLLDKTNAPTEVHNRARFLLLRLAVAGGSWTDVESRSQEILRNQPDEPLRTLASFWHAESAYRRGDQQEAHTRFLDLSLTIEERKEDWLGVVPLRLAQIEAQQQRWSTAAEWAEAAAVQFPKYSRMHEVDYLLGRSLAGLARFDEAREALTRVTTSQSAPGETAAMAQWLVGETWFQQRQYERAIAAYEQTLTHDVPQWRAAALLQAAKCCEQLNRWSDAAQRYQQVIRDHSDTRYIADARSRLEKTQAKVAAQTMTETTTR